MIKTDGNFVDVDGFKERASSYMKSKHLELLRVYGWMVGLRAATKIDKEGLIRETIAVLCGEKQPDRTKKGAPRKHDALPSAFLAEMEELQNVYLCGKQQTEELKHVHLYEQERMEKVAPVNTKKNGSERPYYKITVQEESGRKVACFGTSFDFQIIISSQKPITSTDIANVPSEQTEDTS